MINQILSLLGAISNGPHIGIGRAFAMLEIETILIEIVQTHGFLSVEKGYTVENPNVTLRAQQA